MTKHVDNRYVDLSSRKQVYDVVAHCKKCGLDKEEERKLLKLLGRFASRHELETNIQPRHPRFR